MDSDPVTLSFSKNGNDLGVCYEVEKEKLEDRALFPHILTKNTEYECNFGAKVTPFKCTNHLYFLCNWPEKLNL